MFDYTNHISEVVADVVKSCPALSHIDTGRVVVAVARSHTRKKHGICAKILTLRFEEGKRETVRRGRVFTVPKMTVDGREILYVLYFYLPRFQNLSYEDKLVTIFHELYHVSPLFNGDLRRFDGKNYIHGNSKGDYDALLSRWVAEYKEEHKGHPLLRFLKWNFRELSEQEGDVTGRRVHLPKLVHVEK